MWRPATRTAFAGALLFAMASCAIGVSATPATDKIDQALPNIPTIPHQRPIYPFPRFNDASPDILPTAEPSEPIETAPQPQSDPSIEPSDSPDSSTPSDEQAEPAKPSSPADGWLPPINAHETDPPDDVITPDPTDQPDASDHHGGQDDENASDSDTPSENDGPHNLDGADGSSEQGEISADAVPSS